MHNCTPIAMLLLLSTLVAQSGFAGNVAPDVELKAVTLEVLATIRNDKDIRAGDAPKIAHLVETKILPRFDFDHMTQLATARIWRLATPEQQKALTAEFRTLLVRTYSTALSSYSDQVIEFKPLRALPSDTDVTVRSVIVQSGMAPLSMDYEMEHQASGWKVYDIKIAGVSLVTTYRGTFAATVRESGVEGLIQSLAEKNRTRDADLRSDSFGTFHLPLLLAQALVPRLLYSSHAR